MAAGAASGVEGVRRLRRAGRQLGRVARRARGRKSRTSSRRPSALDALLDERQADRVDLVKIDIEGAEAEAIRGMAAGLERHRYRYVLLECHPVELARLGASVEQCLAPFRRAGYRGWHIDHSAAMHRRAAGAAVSRRRELLAPIDDRRARGGSLAALCCGRRPAKPCRRECVSPTSACRISWAAPRSSCSR